MLHCRYYQALHSLVMAPGEATEVVLLYGSKSASDVLLKDELDGLCPAPAHTHRAHRPIASGTGTGTSAHGLAEDLPPL